MHWLRAKPAAWARQEMRRATMRYHRDHHRPRRAKHCRMTSIHSARKAPKKIPVARIPRCEATLPLQDSRLAQKLGGNGSNKNSFEFAGAACAERVREMFLFLRQLITLIATSAIRARLLVHPKLSCLLLRLLR